MKRLSPIITALALALSALITPQFSGNRVLSIVTSAFADDNGSLCKPGAVVVPPRGTNDVHMLPGVTYYLFADQGTDVDISAPVMMTAVSSAANAQEELNANHLVDNFRGFANVGYGERLQHSVAACAPWGADARIANSAARESKIWKAIKVQAFNRLVKKPQNRGCYSTQISTNGCDFLVVITLHQKTAAVEKVVPNPDGHINCDTSNQACAPNLDAVNGI